MDQAQVEQDIYVSQGSKPNAQPTASKTSGSVPLVIQFIDNTQPTPTDWIWDFGDGDITNSTVRNPLHTYTRNGTFSVTLSVKNNNGLWNSTTIADYITVTSSPSTPANFTANPQSRIAGAPLKVQFIDRSTNVPNEWLWNFGDGDGTNATKKHPIHTYTKNGTFTVTLTATNWSTGSSGFTRTGYITVGPLYAETFRPYMVLIFNRTGSTKWLPTGRYYESRLPGRWRWR